MLYIDGRINVDARLQQLFYILVPFGMPAPIGIGMRQFVYENQLGMPLYGCVQIKLTQGNLVMCHDSVWDLLQAFQQRHCLGAYMRLYIARHHINAAAFGRMRCL